MAFNKNLIQLVKELLLQKKKKKINLCYIRD